MQEILTANGTVPITNNGSNTNAVVMPRLLTMGQLIQGIQTLHLILTQRLMARVADLMGRGGGGDVEGRG